METKSVLLESLQSMKCPQCGCSDVHACTGQMMREWTPQEKQELNDALRNYGWK